MDRTSFNRFLYDAAELGSVALFVAMIFIWAGAIGVA